MAMVRYFVSLTLLATAAAKEVTPMQKVIKLLEDAKAGVEADSKAEAAIYGKFAADCKSHTTDKSASIVKGTEEINLGSAGIESKSAEKATHAVDLAQRKAKKEKLSKDLTTTTSDCAARKAEYEAKEADLVKALASLHGAIEKVKGSKPGESFLLQGQSDHKKLMHTLVLADMMGMIQLPQHRSIVSFLQGMDKQEPDAREYEFHSNDIIETLEAIHKQFTDKKADATTSEATSVTACAAEKAANRDADSVNIAAMDGLSKAIQKLDSEMGEVREELVNDQSDLKDNERYLKDLTAECEARASDWDQRTQMSADEVAAISTALSILSGKVSDNIAVNKRALVQVKKVAAANGMPLQEAGFVHVRKQLLRSRLEVLDVRKHVAQKPVSLLQAIQTHQKPASFLAAGMSSAARKDTALALLATEGQRMNSLVLMAFAQRSSADPFEKVKGLLEKLTERLVQEATAEATKKGFCDAEVGKAEKDRDFRWQDTQELSADLEELRAKRDFHTNTITKATREQESDNTDLSEAIKLRKQDKDANAETLRKARAGKEALDDAIKVLATFYRNAAKASFIQASPIQGDGITAGFSGNYQGRQSGSKAIMGLLETIMSDFDRTIRSTEASETAASREFVKQSVNLKEAIESNEMKLKLNNQDLTTTENRLATKKQDLQTAQDLLDSALKGLETLKPTCIDSGMAFSLRTQKREDEMAALQRALDILADKSGKSA